MCGSLNSLETAKTHFTIPPAVWGIADTQKHTSMQFFVSVLEKAGICQSIQLKNICFNKVSVLRLTSL